MALPESFGLHFLFTVWDMYDYGFRRRIQDDYHNDTRVTIHGRIRNRTEETI